MPAGMRRWGELLLGRLQDRRDQRQRQWSEPTIAMREGKWGETDGKSVNAQRHQSPEERSRDCCPLRRYRRQKELAGRTGVASQLAGTEAA